MSQYEDAGYYEVQLNNKQLVFFFMAAVAIAVVVFLCGVMVGRGVKDTPTVASATGQRERPAASGTTEARRELDFRERLESPRVDDSLGAPAASEARAQAPAAKAHAPPRPAPVSAERVAPPPTTPLPKTPPVTLPAPPAQSGAYAVQVVALKTADSATSLVSRLKTKGYKAYIEPEDSSGLYRVRVGRFDERDQAEKVALRLRDEEKFKPYVIQ